MSNDNVPDFHNIKPNKYSNFDTDHEHLSYTPGQTLPPRVLRPNILQLYGFETYWIKNLALFCNYSLPRMHLLKDPPYFSGVKCKANTGVFKNSHSRDQVKNMKYGDIEIFFDVSTGSGRAKHIIQYPDLPPLYQEILRFQLIFIMDNFVQSIFPNHVHFIMKDNVIYPLPFKYLECRIKSEKGNAGNICADYQGVSEQKDSIDK